MTATYYSDCKWEAAGFSIHIVVHATFISRLTPTTVSNWVELSQAESSWVELRRAEPSWAKLSQAELRWVALSHTELRWVELSQAESSWVELSWAELSWVELSQAELSWVKLSQAELSWVELSWAESSWVDKTIDISILVLFNSILLFKSLKGVLSSHLQHAWTASNRTNKPILSTSWKLA